MTKKTTKKPSKKKDFRSTNPLGFNKDFNRPEIRREAVRVCLELIHKEKLYGDFSMFIPQLMMLIPNPCPELVWLAAFDLNPEISEIAVLFLQNLLDSEYITDEQEDEMAEVSKKEIYKILQNPKVPDERKLLFGGILSYCDDDFSEQKYQSYFKNYQEAHNQKFLEMVKIITGTPSSIQKAYAIMGFGPDFMAEEFPVASELIPELIFKFTELLLTHNPPAVPLFLAYGILFMAENSVQEVHLKKGLGILEELRTPESAWYLNEIARWSDLGPIAVKARMLAGGLANDGIQESAGFTPDFSHALVTGIDGQGDIQLLIIFRTPQGGIDVLIYLISDKIGFKDCWQGFDAVSSIEEKVREETFRNGLTFAHCPLAFARTLLENAWYNTVAHKRRLPKDLLLSLPYLGDAHLQPARHVPDVSIYKLESISPRTELFTCEDELMDLPMVGDQWFCPDAAYEYLKSVKNMRSEKKRQEVLSYFLQNFVIQEEAAFMDRLAANLELEALAGNAQSPIIRAAAMTWYGIKEKKAAFIEVPLIMQLAAKSIAYILANIKEGYNNQQEVNQASLARQFEDELDEAPPF